MVQKTAKKVTKQAVPAAEKPERVQRDQVITFRLSKDEAALIAKAADRIPLARYSRDAVLAKATAETK